MTNDSSATEQRMLNSFEIAAVLRQHDFTSLTDAGRTKAHGYEHPRMPHPVYVKIAGRKGNLKPVDKAPLVIHHDDGILLESIGIMPDGVTMETGPYHSEGLAKYRWGEDTPNGRALAVRDVTALKRLLALLMRQIADDTGARSTMGQAMHDAEPELPDTWEARAATEAVDADPQSRDIGSTTRLALINARLGQGGFRRRMMAIWDNRCAVTGCSVPEVLIASHAQAWAQATNAARLDPYNGLLLIASLDRLFDQGLISFREDGSLLRQPGLKVHELMTLGINDDTRLRFVHAKHRPYLAAHRQAFGFTT